MSQNQVVKLNEKIQIASVDDSQSFQDLVSRQSKSNPSNDRRSAQITYQLLKNEKNIQTETISENSISASQIKVNYEKNILNLKNCISFLEKQLQISKKNNEMQQKKIQRMQTSVDQLQSKLDDQQTLIKQLSARFNTVIQENSQLVVKSAKLQEQLQNTKERIKRQRQAFEKVLNTVRCNVQSLKQQVQFYQTGEIEARKYLDKLIKYDKSKVRSLKSLVQSAFSELSGNLYDLVKQIDQLCNLMQIDNKPSGQIYDHWKQLNKIQNLEEAIVKMKNQVQKNRLQEFSK